MGIIPANTGKIEAPAIPAADFRDHPREYGENPAFLRSFMRKEGSSPRIRGKCGVLPLGWHDVGIIPANTGKIARRGGRRRSYGDHPREYGENIGSITNIVREKGSSPRIRGKLLHQTAPTSPRRIIPANTGKIFLLLSLPRVSGDHPREYGENPEYDGTCPLIEGSSPRIRGKSPHGPHHAGNRGIIPANTGKMRISVRCVMGSRDHPREYGENRGGGG